MRKNNIISFLVLFILIGCPFEPTEPTEPEVVDPQPQYVYVTYIEDHMSASINGQPLVSYEKFKKGTVVDFSFKLQEGEVAKLVSSYQFLALVKANEVFSYKVNEDLALWLDSSLVYDEQPSDYTVRIGFSGSDFASRVVDSSENDGSHVESIVSWFKRGSSIRKDQFEFYKDSSIIRDSYSAKVEFPLLTTQMYDDVFLNMYKKKMDAVVLSYGLGELKAAEFNGEEFLRNYKKVVEDFKVYNDDIVRVLLPLPPFELCNGGEAQRWKEIQEIITTVASDTQSIYLNLSPLYQKDFSEAKVNRLVAEEIYLSFYNLIEAKTVKPADFNFPSTPNRKTFDWSIGAQNQINHTRVPKILAYEKSQHPQFLFIGDSITDFWDQGRHKNIEQQKSWWVTNAGYNEAGDPLTGEGALKYRILDLGIGGDTTQAVLYRYGITDTLDPTTEGASGPTRAAIGFKESVKAIFLMIGTNNVGFPKNDKDDYIRPNSAVETFKGVVACVELLKSQFPHSDIVVQELMPRSEMSTNQYDLIRVHVKALNRLLKSHFSQGDKRVRFIETYETFAQDDGLNNSDYFEDNLHPNYNGYQKWWNDILKSALESYLPQNP